jgi:sugar O-acyltransferase (sialic acid O-acetyltransferase NeuD family)
MDANHQHRRVLLLGGGGHASDVLTAIEALQDAGAAMTVVGLVDNGDPDPRRFARRGVTLLGAVSDLSHLSFDCYVGAVGYPSGRRRMVTSVPAAIPALTVVHPQAVLSKHAGLGDGAVVLALAQVSAGVRIEAHALVSYGALIGHDTIIGEFASVMPGAAIGGGVTIERDAMIGAHATVLEGRKVGAGAQVGAGAVVTRDVAPGVTVVGIPARAVE